MHKAEIGVKDCFTNFSQTNKGFDQLGIKKGTFLYSGIRPDPNYLLQVAEAGWAGW